MGRRLAGLVGIVIASLTLALGTGAGTGAGAAHPHQPTGYRVLAEDKGPTGATPGALG
ncbi:hypothetical protein LN042_13630 [Kitasatospora sp. RB6PN24]|uniref:hypothetical protein n=1 Tax=Kitasatospora humi TaxID=2893891 RepID=UPI001E32EDBE|nr:hypothetical protein [Kitasatospora humi]MCC9308114.1 hypothetical protein [Kitasatospora humi]